MVHLLALLLIVASLLLSNSEQKVYIHIGPHKTGTTHLQQLLHRHEAALTAKNWCFPIQTDPKGFHLLADAILKGSDDAVSLQMQPIEQCLRAGRHVVLSSETFSYLPYHQATHKLQQLFQGYSVHIVGVYREWLQHMYSSYAQESKLSYYTVPFSAYLFSPDAFPAIEMMARSKVEVFRSFEAVFGVRNVTWIDYDGVAAAGRDIAQVILCETIGILCNKTSSISIKRQSNATPNMLLYNLFAVVRDFAKGLGCRFCHSRSQTFFSFIDHHQNTQLSPRNQPFPTIESSLSEMKEIALQRDAEVRRQLGDRLRYSNATAAVMGIQAMRVKILNTLVFFSDCSRCTKWLREEVMRWTEQGLLCGCEQLRFPQS